MGPCVIVEEPMKILDLSDEKDKKNIYGDQWLSTINYVGRNATIDSKARSYIYPMISIRFGKLTKFWRWRKKNKSMDDGSKYFGIERD
jgi:hypothetical protein